MSGPAEHEIFSRLIQNLGHAAGCCQQLAHSRQDPRWLLIRDTLEALRESTGKLAIRSALTPAETTAMLDRMVARSGLKLNG